MCRNIRRQRDAGVRWYDSNWRKGQRSYAAFGYRHRCLWRGQPPPLRDLHAVVKNAHAVLLIPSLNIFIVGADSPESVVINGDVARNVRVGDFC